MRSLFRGIYRFFMNRVLREWPAAELSRPALVFAPHQDDETLGCGGTILRKRRAGAKVKIVFLTDGSSSHARLMPGDQMKAIRAREALAAARVLEVAADDVLFLAMKDGQLTQNQAAGVEKTADILRREQPAEVFIPYYRDGPPDHLATTRIVLKALKTTGHDAVVYEYPVWFWNHWPWTRMEGNGRERWNAFKDSIRAARSMLRDFRCYVRVGDLLECKRAALDEHVSQMKPLISDPSWTTLDGVSGGEFLACFFQEREIFYQHRP